MKDLDFFLNKYTEEHALKYFKKHNLNFKRIISNFFEQWMVSRAIKTIRHDIDSVLDFPCGTGRFWKLLTSYHFKKFYVADYNLPMLKTGLKYRENFITRQITNYFQDSAFKTKIKSNLVDCVLSIRFFHHVQKSADRITALKQYFKITKKYLIITLWTDGNYKSRRYFKRIQKRKELNPNYKDRDRVLIPDSQLRMEFTKAGFEVVKRISMIPYYEQWHAYILKKIK